MVMCGDVLYGMALCGVVVWCGVWCGEARRGVRGWGWGWGLGWKGRVLALSHGACISRSKKFTGACASFVYPLASYTIFLLLPSAR